MINYQLFTPADWSVDRRLRQAQLKADLGSVHPSKSAHRPLNVRASGAWISVPAIRRRFEPICRRSTADENDSASMPQS